jgi:hypothetical protein
MLDFSYRLGVSNVGSGVWIVSSISPASPKPRPTHPNIPSPFLHSHAQDSTKDINILKYLQYIILLPPASPDGKGKSSPRKAPPCRGPARCLSLISNLMV